MGNRARVSQPRGKFYLLGQSFLISAHHAQNAQMLKAQVCQNFLQKQGVLKNECYRAAAIRHEKQGYIY
jgi:hypothetical protein